MTFYMNSKQMRQSHLCTKYLKIMNIIQSLINLIINNKNITIIYTYYPKTRSNLNILKLGVSNNIFNCILYKYNK